ECKTRPLGHWPRPQGRNGEARRDRVCVATRLTVTFLSRRGWLSRSCRTVYRRCDCFSDRLDRCLVCQNGLVGCQVRTALTRPGQPSRSCFPVFEVRLLNSDRARTGRRRRGGSRPPCS
ncbi:hypothetical protein Taro_037363, partial [Colocasia esculenta]|nr:hypothetical protein [Colocasia esculenta]